MEKNYGGKCIGLNINLFKEKNRKELHINLILVIKLEFHINVVLLNEHIMQNGVLKFLKFKGDIEGKINQYTKQVIGLINLRKELFIKLNYKK